MASKRLLDTVTLVKATQGIAQKHIALRKEHLDVYSRTSTLAKTVLSQTHRVTGTVKAATFLVSRLSEDAPSWTTNAASRGDTSRQDPNKIPKEDAETREASPAGTRQVLDSNHFHERSQAHSAVDAKPNDLRIQQKKADRDPLPDGSIPSADFDINAPKSNNADSSPKSMPTDDHAASERARRLQRQAEKQIPSETADTTRNSTSSLSEDEHDSDSFYEPSRHTSQTLSSLPKIKIPKHFSTLQQAEQSDINADTFPTAIEATQKIQPTLNASSDAAVTMLSSGKDASGIQPNAAIQVKDETAAPSVPYELQESKVPSTRLGRLWNYSGLAAGMLVGALGERFRRVGGYSDGPSFMLSQNNMERLVSKLSRMRGAALKLGQMMSFQDSKMLPVPIQEVLQRVQDRADYMPASQRDRILAANLGPAWRDLFLEFEEKPLAAASIGQVHKAILKSKGVSVAVKIQYPGVAASIDSDLNNLALLLTASRLLPKGLFLDRTIANARTELAWECDYVREAECSRRFEDLLADDTSVFTVPKTFAEASGKQVLTMEFLDGIAVTRVQKFSQDQRDWIGTQILRLCLREMSEFKYMQTDPNWTNFLFNAKTNKLELLDFGASREYPADFIDLYLKNLVAASRNDKKSVQEYSTQLGYLTGVESKAMVDAHVASVLTLAEPFLTSSPEVYDFKDQTITDRVKALIPTMIRERLVPPPEETYSLHRKLSGAFLLCAKLGSRVRCRELFQNSMEKAGLLDTV